MRLLTSKQMVQVIEAKLHPRFAVIMIDRVRKGNCRRAMARVTEVTTTMRNINQVATDLAIS